MPTAAENLTGALPQLAGSEFGLWFRHKASHAFQGSPESTSILDYIERIDLELKAIGGLQDASARLGKLHQIREQPRSINFRLDSLSEQPNDPEAGRDVLTRLLNRKFLPVVMAKEVLYARQSNNTFGVLAIDVDHFKRINDTHGHGVGDEVLREFAATLQRALRDTDVLARWGGEEFLLLINDTSPDLAIIGVDRARELLAASPLLPHMPDLKVTFSAGLTGYDDVEELSACIERADRALYRAKSEGRDRTVIDDAPPPQVGATGAERLAAAH